MKVVIKALKHTWLLKHYNSLENFVYNGTDLDMVNEIEDIVFLMI
jgi:hypothetical protein